MQKTLQKTLISRVSKNRSKIYDAIKHQMKIIKWIVNSNHYCIVELKTLDNVLNNFDNLMKKQISEILKINGADYDILITFLGQEPDPEDSINKFYQHNGVNFCKYLGSLGNFTYFLQIKLPKYLCEF